jgi:hypothetical protein
LYRGSSGWRRRQQLVSRQCRHGFGRQRGWYICGRQLCELINFQFEPAAGDTQSSDELFQSERTERRDIKHWNILGFLES